MKRGFLNKSNLAKDGLLSLQTGPASSSLRTASSSLPSDMTESLTEAFTNLGRGQDPEASGGNISGSFSQKIKDLRESSSSSSSANLEQQNMQNPQPIKLDYGKVETVPIPENYVSNLNVSEFNRDAKKNDHNNDETRILFTTIPSFPLNGPSDPDGHSEWIVREPTKAKVINAPGYPKPVPKPKGTKPAYIIKPTPDKGLGVFATRNIKMGELIFAERPLLVIPSAIPSTGNVSMMHHYDLKTQMAIMKMEWEKLLEVALGRMKPGDKNAFMDLANSHKEDGSGPILGIVRTNGFSLGIFDGPERRADGSNVYSGVIKIGSRINHSCMPNVNVEFSVPSFSFQCSALIDIKAGEELFYSYCGPTQPVADRQRELAPYGIVCSCPACKHATPETDKLRTEYKKIAMGYILKNFNGGGATTSGKQRVTESAIEPVIKFKDALIREGLHYTSEYKGMIFHIQTFYEDIGMEEKARPYKEEYKRYKLFGSAGVI